MKLIVGLGNPGKEYVGTRHNIGFVFIDNFADSLNIKIEKEKFNGLYTETIINNEKVILLKPLSFMNLSGEVVIKYVNFFKIDIKDVLIINDDLDLPVGKLRLRASGTSGGHNGLKNIAEHLNTNEFKRLRIGISNDKEIPTRDYVLGKFSKEDQKEIDNLKETVNNILNDFLRIDFDRLMANYNKRG